MDSGRLRGIAAGQGGLFTVRQARECGFSGYQIRHRLERGEWQRVVGRALALAGRPLTDALVDRALALTLPDAVLAGPSAARLHGIPVRGAGSCVVSGSREALPGCRVLREQVGADDLVLLDDLMVTGRARTVFDLLRLLDRAQAGELLDLALQQRWITLADLAVRVRAHAGRHGAPALVDLVRHAAAGAHSAAERLALRLLRRARVTGWAANAEIHDDLGRLIALGDIVFRRTRLVIEIDGRAYHVTPEQFQRDRTRQNRLVAAGWRVLRFTWADLTRRPEWVVREVRKIAISTPEM